MLGKLWKHEIKSSARVYGLMYAIAVVFTALMIIYEGIFKHIDIQIEWIRRFADSIFSMLGIGYVIILIAVNILTIVYVIYRFYQTMISDQGYLTHTLPVKTWQLLLSKMLAAYLFQVVSLAVSVLSVFAVIVSAGFREEFTSGMNEMKYFLLNRLNNTNFIIFLILAVLICIVSGIFKTLQYYVCLCAGNLFNSHKLAGSAVVYLVSNIVIGFIQTAMGVVGLYQAEDRADVLFYELEDVQASQVFGFLNGYMAAGLFIIVIGCVILFAASGYILKNKLNLA